MKTQKKFTGMNTPIMLPGDLFVQIAQEAAAIGNRALAIEFIDMAYLAFAGPAEEAEFKNENKQLELTISQQG